MDFDKDKVDEITLALLWLVCHEDRDGTGRPGPGRVSTGGRWIGFLKRGTSATRKGKRNLLQ